MDSKAFLESCLRRCQVRRRKNVNVDCDSFLLQVVAARLLVPKAKRLLLSLEPRRQNLSTGVS